MVEKNNQTTLFVRLRTYETTPNIDLFLFLSTEKFLPFKTPLDSRYNSQIPEENIFDTDMLFMSLKSQKV